MVAMGTVLIIACKVLATALLAYGALSALSFGLMCIANRRKAFELFTGKQRHMAEVFVRFWLALNLLTFLSLGFASILVWSSWVASLALGSWPFVFHGLTALKYKRDKGRWPSGHPSKGGTECNSEASTGGPLTG